MTATQPDWRRRLDAVRTTLATSNLDALVVSTPSNLRHLSGFAGSTGWLVVRLGGTTLVTDGRYDAAVRGSLADGTMAPLTLALADPDYDSVLARALQTDGCRQVGFEASHVTVALLRRWSRATPEVDWQPTENVVEAGRLIKDAFELGLLRAGGTKIAEVAADLGRWVAAGKSERQIAHEIDRAIVARGFERPAFETIVAAGPHSALPHARPTERRLQAGDLVVLDFGGVLDGYCVDLTRMAAVGGVGAEQLAILEAVADAHHAAVAVVRSGTPAHEVDRAARALLEARGLGPAFRHGTGHGLGLDVHEAPRIARQQSGDLTVLQSGMVCTIEPGAYVESIGGARLEDDVVVTATGCEVITGSHRDLLSV